MKLQVGERLPGSGPAQQPGGYVVTGVVSETPWYGLYTGKKILYNFDFSSKRVRETDEKEWLDVYLRTIRYPYLDDPEYVTHRRGLARAEVHVVLGNRASNLWPEPIDLLEIANTRDPFLFSQEGSDLEPVVVFARPHGLLLGDWQQQVLPLASILSVLAEMLEFIDQTHSEGLLLHALGPASILVDRADRVHYVGTDMVIAGAESTPVSGGLHPARTTFADRAWTRLFPPERFPRGFAAPECFQANGVADRRTDLYAWGTLAYFLLVGQMPWQIALEQSRLWAHFQEQHFQALEKVLSDVPASYIANWREQLGIADSPLSLSWPQGILGVLRRVLSSDPARRPGSVAELRRWLIALPPPTTDLVAFRSGTEAKLALDMSQLEPGVEIVLRRSVGQAPREPDEGVVVLEGAPRPVLADPRCPTGDVFYAVFVRRKNKKDTTVSGPTVAELVDGSPAQVMRLAEGVEPTSGELPGKVRLCFQALDPLVVAEGLLRSNLPHVRGWGMMVLQQSGQAQEQIAQPLLWRVLSDDVPALRFEAARHILGRGDITVDLLHRVANKLGRDTTAGALAALQALAPLKLPEAALAAVTARVEAERDQPCPVCGQQVAGKDRLTHLRQAHGHVEVDGSVMPQAQALPRLWEQVLQEGNQRAHRTLLDLYPTGDGKSWARHKSHPYVTALEAVLAESGTTEAEAPPLGHLIQCLRQTNNLASLIPALLRSADQRVCEVGREVLLPGLGEKLRAPGVTAEDVRQALDEVCADADLLEEKIELCYRLPQVGIDEGKLSGVLAQLQAERLVKCSECTTRIRVGDLESHLLTAHRIYQFRGQRRPPEAMRASVLEAVCRTPPDVPAWRMLEMVASAEYGQNADRRIVTWACQQLRATPRKDRPAAMIAVAEAMTAAGAGMRLLPVLLAPIKSKGMRWLARSLGLEVVGLLPPPVDRKHFVRVKPLLSDRHFSRLSRLRAVVGLLRTTGKDSPGAAELLSAYIAETGKLRALDKLRELEQQVGKSATLDRLYSETEDQVRMACPRCTTQLRRGQMLKHLWERHRLMLDGLRAREPWRMLEDWIVDYRLEKDPALFRRCRDLARQLDGAQGLMRLQQLLLRHGVDDPQARTALLEQAHKQHATLCPKCFHFLPVAEVPRHRRIELDDEELRGHGFRLEISERGPTPRLEVETPDEIVYRGREPGRVLTRLGGLMVFVVPIVLATFVVTEVATGSSLPALVILALALGCGLFFGSLVFLLWPRVAPAKDRLVDAAWTLLAPELFEKGLSPHAVDFLCGLALVSRDRGQVEVRGELLSDFMTQLRTNKERPHYLLQAAITRLQVDDLLQKGDDAVPLLVDAVRSCFVGERPLVFAESLLTDLHAGDLPRGFKERLKVQLADAAFQARLEVRSLQDLGLACPPLARWLDLKNADSLVALRYLWSLGKDRPWERCGKARTAFELAASDETADLLDRHPYLLLAVRGAPIFLAASSVWCKEVCIKEKPRNVDIVKLPRGEGYHLVVGRAEIWFDQSPERLAGELERWLTYYFVEFQSSLLRYPALSWGDGMRKLAARNALPCPRCRRLLIPCEGEIGINMDEEAPTTWV